MKKVIYLVLMLMVVLTLSACRDTEENKVDIKTVASFDEVILTEENNVISVTFIEDGNAESAYQTFKNEMEGIDTTKVIALSTTIGGMLYEMGIIPLGVTSSSNLHKDLIARRCDVVSINEDGSVNYGSSCIDRKSVV